MENPQVFPNTSSLNNCFWMLPQDFHWIFYFFHFSFILFKSVFINRLTLISTIFPSRWCILLLKSSAMFFILFSVLFSVRISFLCHIYLLWQIFPSFAKPRYGVHLASLVPSQKWGLLNPLQIDLSMQNWLSVDLTQWPSCSCYKSVVILLRQFCVLSWEEQETVTPVYSVLLRNNSMLKFKHSYVIVITARLLNAQTRS